MRQLHHRKRVGALGVAAFALLGAGLVHAEDGRHAAAPDLATRTRTRITSLFDNARQGIARLHLTPDQQAQLRQLAHKNWPQARAIWTDKSLTPAQRRAKLMALRAEGRKVLTPQQMKQAEELKTQAFRQAFAQMRWVSQELQLTPDQQDRIHAVVWDSFQQGRDLRATRGANPPDFASVRGLIEQTAARVKQVLTPSQQAKWSIIQSAARQTIVQNMRELRQSGMGVIQD
jgi:hypothetical protein